MTFKKGDTRPPGAGRKKGSGAKARVLRVHEVLAEHDVNPIEKLLAVIPKLKESEQARIWLELQSYIQGKSTRSADEIEANEQDSEPSPASNLPDDALLAIVKPR